MRLSKPGTDKWDSLNLGRINETIWTWDGYMRLSEPGTDKWDYLNLGRINETIWTWDRYMRLSEPGTDIWDYLNLERINETIWTYDEWTKTAEPRTDEEQDCKICQIMRFEANQEKRMVWLASGRFNYTVWVAPGPADNIVSSSPNSVRTDY